MDLGDGQDADVGAHHQAGIAHGAAPQLGGAQAAGGGKEVSSHKAKLRVS